MPKNKNNPYEQAPQTPTFKLNYQASPTLAEFHASNAFVRGVKGPIGSGKSVGCCLEIFIRAKQQHPSTDGKRRTRWAVVRNTGPELETTTIKTWLDWFPEAVFGKMNRKPPITHRVAIEDIELEVIFLALDRPDDVKKLLSLEVTGIFFNEARFIHKDNIDAGTGRVGRYPAKREMPDDLLERRLRSVQSVIQKTNSYYPIKILDQYTRNAIGTPKDLKQKVEYKVFEKEVIQQWLLDSCSWPTWYGIVMDTNPPDDDHWWYKAAESAEWRKDPITKEIRPLDEIYRQEQWEFWGQPSGLEMDAENIENLPAGYYDKLMVGKSTGWIDVFVKGKYGTVQSGKPVYGKSYNDELHSTSKGLIPIPMVPLDIGLDFGNTPAAVITQTTPLGQRLILEEIVTEDTAIQDFAEILKRKLQKDYPGFSYKCYGDPSGKFKDQQQKTAFNLMKTKGIQVTAAPSNEIKVRIEAVVYELNKITNGQPAYLIDGIKCPILKKGFTSKYKYRKLNVSGSDKFEDKPEKNEYSHIHDANQYVCLSTGSYRAIMVGNKKSSAKTVINKSNWSVWNQ